MYSEKVLEHFKDPQNVGEMKDHDGMGTVGNPVCGDMMSMYIKVKDDKIEDISFKTFGCGAAIATSSMTTELAKGKTLDEALEMMSDQYQMLKPDETKMSDFISSWYLHTKSFLNDTDHKVLLIRYEEMRENPVDTFSRMLKHAGVDPVEEKVKAALELVDIEKLRDQESKNGFGEASPHADGKFFGPGKVGGWRGKLTPKQIHTIEKRFGGLMKRLGYLEKRRAA